MAPRKTRARYVEGKPELLDPVSLPEDAEVLLTLDDETPMDDDEEHRLMGEAVGGWKQFFDEDPTLAEDLYRRCACCPRVTGDA
jgi:hypothetical protein